MWCWLLALSPLLVAMLLGLLAYLLELREARTLEEEVQKRVPQKSRTPTIDGILKMVNETATKPFDTPLEIPLPLDEYAQVVTEAMRDYYGQRIREYPAGFNYGDFILVQSKWGEIWLVKGEQP